MPFDDFRPATFDQEESADLRRQYVRHAIRLSALFAALFAGVYLAFWWSGAAVGFGASRVGDGGTASWHVIGTVRSAATHDPIPWVRIDDDPAGRPPFFHAEGDRSGNFDLLTMAEPHRILISARGYRTLTVSIGRAWFVWLPRGKERYDTELLSE